MDRDDIRFHGRDERLLVSSFYEGPQFLYDVVKKTRHWQIRADAIYLPLYSMSLIAARLAAFASRELFNSSASIRPLLTGSSASGTLQFGQRFANPGLSGFNSNSSSHTEQILMGKGISTTFYDGISKN